MILVRNLRLSAEEEFALAAERLPELAARKLRVPREIFRSSTPGASMSASTPTSITSSCA